MKRSKKDPKTDNKQAADFLESDKKEDVPSRKTLKRLFSYLLRYPIRLSIGLLLALFISLSNLFLLGGMASIIDIIGSDASKTVKIFILSNDEKKLLVKKVNANEELSSWQSFTKGYSQFQTQDQ